MSPEVARRETILNWEAIDSYGFGVIAHNVAHTNTLSDDSVASMPSFSFSVAGSWLLRGSSRAASELDSRDFTAVVADNVPDRLARLIYSCLEVSPALRPQLFGIRVELEAMALSPPTTDNTNPSHTRSHTLSADAAVMP